MTKNSTIWAIEEIVSYGGFLHVVRAENRKEAIRLAEKHFCGFGEPEIGRIMKINNKGKSMHLIEGGSVE